MIFAAAAMADGLGGAVAPVPPLDAAAWTILPLVAICLIVDAWMRVAWRALARTGSHGTLRRADGALRVGQIGVAIWFSVAAVVFGWIDGVRATVGDLVLVDEVLALAPPLLAGLWLWWSHAPIALAAREAAVIGSMERGEPVYPLMSRWQYVVLEARLGYGLILTAMTLVLGWTDAVRIADETSSFQPTGPAAEVWRLAWESVPSLGILAILLVTPGLVTWVWPTTSLGPGPTREALLDVCRREGLEIQDILVWQTRGGLATAGVFGVVPRFRYVLFGDAALDLMNTPTLVAIMAHEAAHVRRRHLVWLLVMAGALFGIVALGMREAALPQRLEGVLVMTVCLVALWPITWACRRFEWQADASAAVHMTKLEHDDAAAGGTVSGEGAGATARMLTLAAELNGVDPLRWTLWHGSIEERRRRLLTLVGKRFDELPIDRSVRRIKLATLAVVAAVCVGAVAGPFWGAHAGEKPAEPDSVVPARAVYGDLR